MTAHRRTYALFGVVAGLLGLAVGDLAATLIAPAASPLLVVGSALIDLAPTAAKMAAIEWFGAADKPLLIVLVALGTLGFAALAGALSRNRPALGVGVIGGLSVLVAAIAATRSNVGQYGPVPALVTGAVAIGALLLLRRWSHSSGSEDASGRVDDGSAPSRRVLIAALGGVALAGVIGGVARGLRRQSVPPPGRIALPKPADPLGPLPRGLGAEGITRLRTPVNEFYRVDTRLRVPSINADEWRLTIDGDVARPVTFTYAQLLRMPLIERDITLVCVSNTIGGPYAGGARWLGVPLSDLLERAGTGTGKADQILSTDVGGMTISTPLDAATDGRDAMIAIGMNGQPLPAQHGYPARLIVPGLYGFIGATKWITRMTLTTYAAQDAYWTQRGWATEAPIKLASRIDTPRRGEEIDAGDVVIGGIAWAHDDGGVAKIQVSIDRGPWRNATLGPSGGSDYWRQWFVRWEAPKGRHSIRVRTVGANGDVQSGRLIEPFPDGASGFHTVEISAV